MAIDLSIVQPAPAKTAKQSDSADVCAIASRSNGSFETRARVLFVAVDEHANECYQDFLMAAIERLSLTGSQCYVLVSKPGALSKRASQRGLYYFLLDSEAELSVPSWRRNFSRARQICAFLRQYTFDVVVYLGPSDLPVVRIAAWMSGTPIRIAVAYDPAYCSSWAGEALEFSTSNLDTETVALSDWIGWKYQKLGRADVMKHRLCSVQPENFDIEKFDCATARADVLSRLGISSCTKLVCLFGDFQPYYPRTSFFPEHLFGVLVHDSRLFVKSIKAVLDKHPDAHFVVVGTQKDAHGQGYAKYLRDFAIELGVSEHFHCLPESQTTPQLLAAADIVVQPAHLDVAPNIVRALLMEKPVIATRREGEPSIIEHNKTGLLVLPDDSVALSEAIESLFDVEVARKLATAGRQAMLQRANLDESGILFSKDIGRSSTRRDSRLLPFVRFWLGMFIIFCLKFMLKAKAMRAGKAESGKRMCDLVANFTFRWLGFFTGRLKKMLQ
ncbi:MAG: hypothetical protein C0469_01010 [Cyanobacteria bacterium DS2.3.42]|nr:hypothetical protein [Cyanobacteria bacterium DS2.3.42]